MKILSVINFTTKLLSFKDYLLLKWTPIERSLRSLLRSLIAKLLIDNIFIERLGLSLMIDPKPMQQNFSNIFFSFICNKTLDSFLLSSHSWGIPSYSSELVASITNRQCSDIWSMRQREKIWGLHNVPKMPKAFTIHLQAVLRLHGSLTTLVSK